MVHSATLIKKRKTKYLNNKPRKIFNFILEKMPPEIH